MTKRNLVVVLAAAGLDESALQTPPDFPLDDAARDAVVRAGGEKQPVLMNCSGKHAAMLATCVLRGWDTATYLDPAHPLQVAIADTFARLTGEPIDAVAVDGCGAPLLSTSLTDMAVAALLTADGSGMRMVPTGRCRTCRHRSKASEKLRTSGPPKSASRPSGALPTDSTR